MSRKNLLYGHQCDRRRRYFRKIAVLLSFMIGDFLKGSTGQPPRQALRIFDPTLRHRLPLVRNVIDHTGALPYVDIRLPPRDCLPSLPSVNMGFISYFYH